MLAIAESIVPIFLLVAAGVVLRRLPLISQEAWPGIEQLGYWFLYPALLFVTIYNADFSGLRVDALLAALLLCIAVMAGLTAVLWPLLGRAGVIARSEYSTVFQTSIRWNGFIALPVAQNVFPPEGVAVVALAMAVIIIPINITCVGVVMRFANREANFGVTILRIALNPLILACVVAIVLRTMPVELYPPVNETLRLVGSAAIGLGLLAIGAGLRLGDLKGTRAVMWIPVVFKLALFPAVMAAIALMLGLRGAPVEYLVLCAAVPCAMNGYLLARQLGGDAELYAAVNAVQTALSFLTLPLALGLAAQLSSG